VRSRATAGSRRPPVGRAVFGRQASRCFVTRFTKSILFTTEDRHMNSESKLRVDFGDETATIHLDREIDDALVNSAAD